jgi:hypothetical protein
MAPILRKRRAYTSTKNNTATSSSAASKTSEQKLTLVPSALAVNLNPDLLTTTFEHFQLLPAELQARIIKYAWLTGKRDVNILCTYNYKNAPGVSNPDCAITANPKLPYLCLVNELFLSECHFLARPHLTRVSNNNAVPFLPNMDVLQLEIVDSLKYQQDISTWFNALPAELRQKVKYVRLKMFNQKEARSLWISERIFQGVTLVVGQLDAPMLERFEVMGMGQEKLRRLKSLGGMDFEVLSSKDDRRVVKVHWMCIEDLEK